MQKCIKIFKFFFFLSGNLLAKGESDVDKSVRGNLAPSPVAVLKLGNKVSRYFPAYLHLGVIVLPLAASPAYRLCTFHHAEVRGSHRWEWEAVLLKQPVAGPSGWERLQLSPTLLFAPRREESEGGEGWRE